MRKPNEKHHGSATAAFEAEVAPFTPAEELALAEFGNWLDGELEQLVARWIHCAAPNASRRGRAVHRML